MFKVSFQRAANSHIFFEIQSPRYGIFPHRNLVNLSRGIRYRVIGVGILKFCTVYNLTLDIVSDWIIIEGLLSYPWHEIRHLAKETMNPCVCACVFPLVSKVITINFGLSVFCEMIARITAMSMNKARSSE